MLYHGHAVAAVAATSLEIAREAATRIEVEYEVLPPVLTLDQAMAPDAPILHDDLRHARQPRRGANGPTNVACRMELQRGDIDKGFAEADVVVEREFHDADGAPGLHRAARVRRALRARTASVVDLVQHAGPVRRARRLRRRSSASTPRRSRSSPSEIGGGFGGKIPVYLEPLAVVLSRKAQPAGEDGDDARRGVPRHGPTSGTKIRVKIGAKTRRHARRGERVALVRGGRLSRSPVGAGAMCCLASYEIPNVLIEGYDVVVNKPKVAAYRAPGSPMAAFATESVIDEIARTLGIDPIELRLKNAVVGRRSRRRTGRRTGRSA